MRPLYIEASDRTLVVRPDLVTKIILSSDVGVHIGGSRPSQCLCPRADHDKLLKDWGDALRQPSSPTPQLVTFVAHGQVTTTVLASSIERIVLQRDVASVVMGQEVVGLHDSKDFHNVMVAWIRSL